MAAPGFSVQNHMSPAEYGVAVTPSDSTDLPQVARALYVGTGGDLNIDFADGSTVLLPSVLGGVIVPVRARRVRATLTTASNIIALY